MAVKILIVDDEPINVKLIEEILEYEEDFECKSVQNGIDALALLDEYNPDIIILDIMMPGMSGYDVCRRIKSDKKHRFAKVLMVSGKAMIEERLEGYDSGADDYITKPFVDDELLAKLKVFSRLKKTEEIDELKTAILQLFSHETKTPLNGILLGSQLILDTPSVPDKIAEYANLIKMSGERIHELVRKILLLSDLKNNRTLTVTAQSVKKYLQRVASQANESHPESSTICVDCAIDFTLEADWHLFHEAFQSAVNNAIKFSPSHEDVELKASYDESTVVFSVKDKGPGIDPKNQEKIFDEFYSPDIKSHTKGTALSLAIAKEIMLLHRGHLSVESVRGNGSIFKFAFPATSVKL